ncbi:DUF1697 domain-containing protein [Candidatus Roizmanbacteria bacterium]|nr:DUF1697 domain-containing protein [Candidatus Roizmanbacteria bacterium]
MNKYLALFRGINVGGHHQIPGIRQRYHGTQL